MDDGLDAEQTALRMKIGITTFHWSDNYGAVLQAHALQFFLQKRGHVVLIVDYRPPVAIIWLRKWIARSIRGCIRNVEAFYKACLFELFRKKYLVCTSEIFHTARELILLKDRFDLLITGSDQVWNPEWLAQISGFEEFYFLSFAGEKTERISYAASFGHCEKSSMKEEWQKIIAVRLNMMDAISVREQTGVTLVKDLCGRTDAVQVVDPTLLLEREHYEKLAGPPKKKNKYLFVYMLHGLEQDAEHLSWRVAEELVLTVMRCETHKTNIHRGYTLPSPTGWLKKIRDADFVITNSFHGVVFCVVFHKPFAALLIDGVLGTMNSRIVDFLKQLGLEQRIVSSSIVALDQLCRGSIDWQKADRHIEVMKKNSNDFLSAQKV